MGVGGSAGRDQHDVNRAQRYRSRTRCIQGVVGAAAVGKIYWYICVAELNIAVWYRYLC